MKPFLFRTVRAIHSGRGSVATVGAIAKTMDARRMAVICDRNFYDLDGHKPVVKSLESERVDFAVFPKAVSEPSVGSVTELAMHLKTERISAFIGVGGGSAMDTTKLVSALLCNESKLQEMVGTDLIDKPGLPMILVPTTAGTGSEVTPNGILSLEDEGRKAGVVSQYLLPDAVVLDPELSVSLPKNLTASTGMDALIHSLESYIGKKANALSDAIALQGIGLISSNIRTAYESGNDIEAREKMLIGSMFGGMALTAAGTAAVHALAYPIGGKFGVPHGVANSMLLIPVLQATRGACEARLAQVSVAMGLAPSVDAVMNELTALCEELGIPDNLREYGCTESDLDELAVSASKVTRLLDNNPQALGIPEIRSIYASLLK